MGTGSFRLMTLAGGAVAAELDGGGEEEGGDDEAAPEAGPGEEVAGVKDS